MEGVAATLADTADMAVVGMAVVGMAADMVEGLASAPAINHTGAIMGRLLVPHSPTPRDTTNIATRVTVDIKTHLRYRTTPFPDLPTTFLHHLLQCKRL